MKRSLSFVIAGIVLFVSPGARAADPLESWNDGKTKQAIHLFVSKVTMPGSPDFVPVAQRIAVFDNDGTLWAEQPMPFQLAFTIDRVKVLAQEHPDWQRTEPFASILKGDLTHALAGGHKGIMEILVATHAGMTTEEYEKTVRDRASKLSHLDQALAEARASCWTVVDMSEDWRRIFPDRSASAISGARK